jgi:hypothetical protein
MVFFELRWNYSPLKEKAVLLPDGLFVILIASRQTATDCSFSCKISAPDASRSARDRPRGLDAIKKICGSLKSP